MKRRTGGFGQRPWYSRLRLGGRPLLLGGALLVGVLTGSLVILAPQDQSEERVADAVGVEAGEPETEIAALDVEPAAAPMAVETAPVEEVLTEAAPGGDDTLPTWRQFALAAPESLGRPMIALVIDDVGVDVRRSRQVIDLPAPLTLSFLTYARDLEAQAAAGRAAGHELMVHVAMGPYNPDADPGPGALLLALGETEVQKRLETVLSRFPGYVGINNHMGSRFTENEAGMKTVMEIVRSRELLFLDSRTTAKSVGLGVAKDFGVPSVSRDVFLDHVPTLEAVRASLAEVEEVARRKGYAVAIGHPRDATIEVLKEWIPSAIERGFVFVPISTLVAAEIGGGAG